MTFFKSLVSMICEPLSVKSCQSVLSRLPSRNFELLFFRSKSGFQKLKRVQPNMGKKGKNKSSTLEKPKAPSSINLVVVGTGGPGTSRCMLLTTEYSRYIFNCGEGSQRLTAMNKCLKSTAFAKISGVDNIFITHKSWENTGGLLGLAMLLESQKNPEIKNYLNRQKPSAQAEETSKNQDLPELNLYGPDGIEKLTMMARKFAERSNMKIVRKEGLYEDFYMKINPVVLQKESVSVRTMASSESEANAKFSAGTATCGGNPEPAYAYICTATPLAPKINVEKCFDAGITLGPMVGELQRGNSVTLPDGTVVRPEQVTDMLESTRNTFIVVDCPSEEYFNALRNSHHLNDFRASSDKNDSLAIIVHMTPSVVLNSQAYKEWMHSFGEEPDHLIINEDCSSAELSRVRAHQAQLNVVNPQVFPLLPRVRQDHTEDTSDSNPKRGVVRRACSGLVYTLRGKTPGFHVDTDDVNVESLQSDVLDIPEVKEELKKLTSRTENVVSDRPYPKVVFLGTGSSEPNRIRAQSCIAVHLSQETTIVLDCGEDSFGQFFRFYGRDEATRALTKLKAIYISHMHGDHHLGLLTFLKERRKAFAALDVLFEPVILMAPIQMRRWLKFYHSEAEEIFHLFRFHKHQQHLKEFDDTLSIRVATNEDIHNTLGLTEYNVVEVIHVRNSFGLSFTHQSGFKLVYSGDTRPCDRLAQAGQDCDLLIHEATHEDDLLAHAKASKHSTFTEAMDMGKQMKAKQTILTHFSQRYPHMVPFYGVAVPSNVGIAFDNMQVTQETLPLLSSFIPPLTHIFADKLQILEIKSLKRSREQANLDDL